MTEGIISLIGGILLGSSCVAYLYLNGRIVGMSGMIWKTISWQQGFKNSALWFIAGLIITAVLFKYVQNIEIHIEASPFILMMSGLLVGFGTRLGAGCTSGHGICGISRLSKRSFVATVCFMVVAIITVWIVQYVGGL
ncbi:MAG: YeeE/YedE thiosulfate transporter family protein [Acinetobacter sp.]